METKENSVAKLNKLRYSSFPEIFGAMRNMANEYADMPMDMLISSFGNVMGRN